MTGQYIGRAQLPALADKTVDTTDPINNQGMTDGYISRAKLPPVLVDKMVDTTDQVDTL